MNRDDSKSVMHVVVSLLEGDILINICELINVRFVRMCWSLVVKDYCIDLVNL